jgi:hypothetical protein
MSMRRIARITIILVALLVSHAIFPAASPIFHVVVAAAVGIAAIFAYDQFAQKS